MDSYTAVVCFPSQRLARAHQAERAASPVSSRNPRESSPSPVSPSAPSQPDSPPATPHARRHMHSVSASSALAPRPTDSNGHGSSGAAQPPHLSRPASLASLAEHASFNNKSPPTYSAALSHPNRGSVVSADFGAPGSRRSTGSNGLALASEPSSIASSASTHRTSASLGSIVGPASSATSAPSVTSGPPSTTDASTSPSLHALLTSQQELERLSESMGKLCSAAMARFNCMISFAPLRMLEPYSSGDCTNVPSTPIPLTANAGLANSLKSLPCGQGFTVQISGTDQQIKAARAFLYQQSPFMRKCVLRVPSDLVMDSRSSIRPELANKMDDLFKETGGHIVITRHGPSTQGFSTESESIVEFQITGSYDRVEQCRFKLLLFLDALNGMHTDFCFIDYKLHNLVAGRKREVFQNIEEDSGVNIYLPPSFRDVFCSLPDEYFREHNRIYMTGDSYQILRAKSILSGIAGFRTTHNVTSRAIVTPRKLEWILQERLEDVKQIMFDNGTFIQFPVYGTSDCHVTVTGESTTHVRRTLKHFFRIVAELVTASVWLFPAKLDVFSTTSPLDSAQVPSILQRIAVASGAEVVFKTSNFEIHGLESEVREAIKLILELEELKSLKAEVRVQFEYTNEQRDFLAGKKNGKLTRITKDTNTQIKFEGHSDDLNFIINISGNRRDPLTAWDQVNQEIPSELTFYIPDPYHKKIIGVRGANIQSIMKDYSVFVKFSSLEEYATEGGHDDNDDNCLCRTPGRNAHNLEPIKNAILQDLPDADKDFQHLPITVPRRYHSALLCEKGPFVKDIARKTNSVFRFPSKESGSDIVKVFGPDAHVQLASQMLLTHVPMHATLSMPFSSKTKELMGQAEFLGLLEDIRRNHNIVIQLPRTDFGPGDDIDLRFSFTHAGSSSLGEVRDKLVDFLTCRDVPLYPGSMASHVESDSDAAFQHFNSAILSNGSRSATGLGHRSIGNQELLMSTGSGPSLTRPPAPPRAAPRVGPQPSPQTPRERFEAFNPPGTPFSPSPSGQATDHYPAYDRFGRFVTGVSNEINSRRPDGSQVHHYGALTSTSPAAFVPYGGLDMYSPQSESDDLFTRRFGNMCFS